MQETFHQYHLITELAKKHSRSTYLASPTHEPDHQVVLTVLSASLFRFPHERENLLQKAQLLKNLQHEHLVSILNIGIEEEQPFVVREYLPNGSLRSHLKKLSPDHLELANALTITLQVGQALVYAHQHNIVHGNIKPENILFDTNGQAVLADFSLVGSKDALIHDQISQEYAFCYLAPEQFAGVCDCRSDQYALGCLAYELITGRVPFASQDLTSMMGQPSNTQPAPLSERVADLPPVLEMAVLKTLANDPDQRFFDFSLFLEAIESVLSLPSAFSLSRSPSSEKKGTISHGVPITVIEIHKEATKRPATRAPERSGIPSHIKACALKVRTMTQRHGPMRVLVQHSRRRGLELGLVLSFIVAVVCSALWVSGIFTLGMGLHGTDTNPLTAKKGIQAVATQTTKVSTGQLSTQATKVSTGQPSAQAMNVLTVQPSAQAVSIPIIQSPSPISAPVVGSTPMSSKTYDASDSRNTLSSGARLVNCSSCPNGYRVGYIGLNSGEAGTLQFNNVSKNVAGQYTLTIDYILAGSDKLTMDISVNGASAVALNVPQTSTYTVETIGITISLNAGNNTIEFSNPSNPAPDIDWIVV